MALEGGGAVLCHVSRTTYSLTSRAHAPHRQHDLNQADHTGQASRFPTRRLPDHHAIQQHELDHADNIDQGSIICSLKHLDHEQIM